MKKQGAVICGFYGHSNLGDEAMLSGMIHLLKKQQNNLSFTVFSHDPKLTQKQHSVHAIDRETKQYLPQRILAILKNRYFILGGGDLLRDTAKFPIAKNWLSHLQKAIRLQRQTMILGVSVGDLVRQDSKTLIPNILNQVNLIGVRDALSQAKLVELGVNKPIHIISDLALEALPETVIDAEKFSVGQPLQIGISIRNLQGRGASVDVSQYPTFQKEMAKLADSLVEKYNATVHFLPLRSHPNHYHPTDDDYIACLELFRYSRYSSQFIVHRCFPSLEQFYQLTRQLHLMIGMRLHSLIIAAGLGVPVIAAEYDSKVQGFMAEIGQAQSSIPFNCFEADQILSLIENRLENPLTAHQDVVAGVQQYRQRMLGIEAELQKELRVKN